MAAPPTLQSKIDETLDKVFSTMKKWTPEERTAYCEDGGDHPLFAPVSSAGDVASASALRAVEYDELDSPAVLAAEFKEKGNAAFKAGPAFYGNALLHYRDAVRHAGFAVATEGGAGSEGGGGADGSGSSNSAHASAAIVDPHLISTCHANISAIHLARGKYISTLDACHEALRAWPGNAKACWRGAKAALALGRAEAAIALAAAGRASAIAAAPPGEPAAAAAAAAPFVPLTSEAEALLARQGRAAAATALELAAREGGLQGVRAACLERGIRVGPPLFNGMKRTLANPFLGDGGTVHWPVVLLYPAVGHSDYVEAWCEEDSLGELLDQVLPPCAPHPQWDGARAYSSADCDIFFKSNPCKSLPVELAWTAAAAAEEPEDDLANDVRWVRCPREAPLLAPLVHPGYVVADLPVFYVVPRGSGFYRDMLRAAKGRFAELPTPGGEV